MYDYNEQSFDCKTGEWIEKMIIGRVGVGGLGQRVV
jgi:hypothetical protein